MVERLAKEEGNLKVCAKAVGREGMGGEQWGTSDACDQGHNRERGWWHG